MTRLNEAGFAWNSIEAKWNVRYSELMLFKKETGHCRVSQKYKPNPQLGEWCITQRKHFKKGWLSLERIAKLNQIGFVWDARCSSNSGSNVVKNDNGNHFHDDDDIMSF